MRAIPPKCGNSSYVDHNFSNIFIHFTIVFEIPVSVFAVYCILMVTPSRAIEMKIFYALILIALVPNVFLIFPITGMLIGAENSMSYNPALGEYMVSSLSIHGVLSTLTLILSHKPYRLEADRLRRKLFCSKSGSRNSTVKVECSTKSVKY
ncbi:Protein CBG06712 [Caenorhabditis briggsae]|uniref:Protein CBG06712 n=1 Tax=Caenorhabditis briggsae TaxID=6238 RepID=A8X2X4_CAEBR|nr:Protein CBG06712 [Caenorhabditis briggsae]CAP26984.2 Protein CBG06712 [Caenorhabditis briggsae]